MPRSPLAALTALALVTMPACQGDALHPPESKRIPLAGSPARPPAPSGDVWEAIPPDIDWTPWHESHPWLTDVSSWYERFDRRDGRLTRRFEGAFGLGNG